MRTLTTVSLLANAVLGLLLWYQSQPVPQTGATQLSARLVASAAVAAEPAALPQETPGPPAAPAFRWSQLESTDYWTYVANLRSIGCPEQTIHDIVSADLDSAYFAQRRQALQQISATAGAADYPAVTTEIQQMGDEESALVERLLAAPAVPVAADNGQPPGATRPAWFAPGTPYVTAGKSGAANQPAPAAATSVNPMPPEVAIHEVGDPVAVPAPIQPVNPVADNLTQSPDAPGSGSQPPMSDPTPDPTVAALRAQWELARRNADYSLRGLLGRQRYLDYLDSEYLADPAAAP